MAFFPFSMIQGKAFFFPSNLYRFIRFSHEPYKWLRYNNYSRCISKRSHSGFVMSVNDLIPD